MSITQTQSPRNVRSALNRLIIADRDEGLALDAAARVVRGAERRQRLLQQALRRSVFQRDLGAAITGLGGVPAESASYRAKIGSAARRIRQVLTGPHEGDAYASCARAAERTSVAYSRALRSTLPPDVRFGVQRAFSEIEWDCAELRRLRFGARLATLPVRSGELPRFSRQ